jgi:translation initiation factor IF-3
LRPKTNEAHRGFKVDDARRWLNRVTKVRVTVKFRGREMDYPEIALEDLREIAHDLLPMSPRSKFLRKWKAAPCSWFLVPAKAAAEKERENRSG